LQASVTVSSLQVSFGGLIYFNEISHVNDFKAEYWEKEDKSFDPLIKPKLGPWPSREEVEQVQEKAPHVSEIMEMIKKLRERLFWLVKMLVGSWATSTSAALVLLLTHPSLPWSEALLLFSVGGLFIESVSFALSLSGSFGLFTISYIDAEFAAHLKVLKLARERIEQESTASKNPEKRVHTQNR
jgi:hypothetical protein